MTISITIGARCQPCGLIGSHGALHVAQLLPDGSRKERVIKLLERAEIAERLQREMFVGAFGRIAFVKPEADEVGNDAPAAGGRSIDQIIPTLIDGRPSVACGRGRDGPSAL